MNEMPRTRYYDNYPEFLLWTMYNAKARSCGAGKSPKGRYVPREIINHSKNDYANKTA